jgi:hypothetical protein
MMGMKAKITPPPGMKHLWLRVLLHPAGRSPAAGHPGKGSSPLYKSNPDQSPEEAFHALVVMLKNIFYYEYKIIRRILYFIYRIIHGIQSKILKRSVKSQEQISLEKEVARGGGIQKLHTCLAFVVHQGLPNRAFVVLNGNGITTARRRW